MRGHAFRLLSALYHDEPMLAIWSPEETVATWLRVESELAQAQAETGLLRQDDADAISAVCRPELIDLDRLWEGARTVGYPILPLVRQIAGHLPPGPDGRVHYGATTQDIMDTGLALQLVRSCDRLIELALEFGDALAALTGDHAEVVVAARTHAQQAVPTTFGAKTAVFLGEVAREVDELRRVRPAVGVVSLFGAGGTNAAMGEDAARVRAALARRLGLADTDVPWHVARDRVARFGQACSLLAATCVRFAREVVDLSRTEIGEVGEEDGHHRGASSTMPQKVNPISSESVIGYGVAASGSAALLARAMEAGHERSAGEWQIEWLAVPQLAEYTAAAVRLSAGTAGSLRVFPERMRANLALDGGLLMSEALMMRLAPALGRERAHDLVYAAAARARAEGADLVGVCARDLPEDVREEIGPLLLDPAAYLGEAMSVASSAVREWKTVRNGGGA
ncbi:adenylosuccinate lyase [Actinomadura viridis]|uniref:3-carboxy-cis,cis-muconate cycloisomerase n=1 Tax=Actinomadura viridis TaxID=58110 RepID=A0A931DI04_9ACTN|nr:adenylosuccinate lyase family protein [Actinomadura viridis]MBG6089109.1 3-carboxy-cis,cis-muconate cycloisomerase [Actinomadura viridis]